MTPFGDKLIDRGSKFVEKRLGRDIYAELVPKFGENQGVGHHHPSTERQLAVRKSCTGIRHLLEKAVVDEMPLGR